MNITLKVKVQVFGLEKIDFEFINGVTVEDLLKQLFDLYPDALNKFFNPKSGKIYSYVGIWVNSFSIKHLQNFKTNLKEGDVITIFRPSAGG